MYFYTVWAYDHKGEIFYVIFRKVTFTVNMLKIQTKYNLISETNQVTV